MAGGGLPLGSVLRMADQTRRSQDGAPVGSKIPPILCCAGAVTLTALACFVAVLDFLWANLWAEPPYDAETLHLQHLAETASLGLAGRPCSASSRSS